jgi:hypothetical protein
MADASALKAALTGVYGVFSVQNSMTAGLEKEVLQGVTLADAAQAAGVRHLVYTSAGGADRESGVPHFETKWQIEQHIRAIGLPATILRPVSFMEGFGAPGIQRAFGLGIFGGAVPADKPTQMIAVPDIAVGKVLLAYLPADQVHELLTSAPLEALTPKTVTSVPRLERQLAQIRHNGVAINSGETFQDAGSLAAPIRDRSGKVVAAVSNGYPLYLVSEADLPRLTSEVVECADEISRLLGAKLPDREAEFGH